MNVNFKMYSALICYQNTHMQVLFNKNLWKLLLLIPVPALLAMIPMGSDEASIAMGAELNQTEEVYAPMMHADPHLSQNFPNSFRRTTGISYSIPSNGWVNLSIYDLDGNKKGELVNKNQNAGSYLVHLDALPLDNGLYLYKLQVGEFEEARTMLLMR